jgi:hypothetical protein
VNGAERAVANVLTRHGWKLLTAGWPDFLCVRKRNGEVEVRGVEVKVPSGFVTPRQSKMHAALKSAGLDTTVVVVASRLIRKRNGEYVWKTIIPVDTIKSFRRDRVEETEKV